MELNEKLVNLRKLTPKAGMWLTQAYETENRVFSDGVYLAVSESPDNWREATEQEKLAYEAEEKARMEAEQAEHEREMLNN